MKVNLKKLLKLKAKGHTKALVYNEYANNLRFEYNELIDSW